MSAKRDALFLSPQAIGLRDGFRSGKWRTVRRFKVADASAEVQVSPDSLWLIVQEPGRGGFALRLVSAPGIPLQVEATEGADGRQEFQIVSSQGLFRVTVDAPGSHQPLLRCTVRLTPAEDILMTGRLRDLLLLDDTGDPACAQGHVYAAQRGLNSGYVYLSLARPKFGSLLYFQNLTALNAYFAATGTTPEGCVGGRWPELGTELPSSQEKPLPKGEEITLSDVFLQWSPEIPEDPRQVSRLFLDLLAGVYQHLERPETEYHDWPRLAAQTLRDIPRSPDVTVKHFGDLYLRPYTAAEEPDSMVQLTVLMPIREYQTWQDKAVPLAEELRKGLKHFFDPQLSAFRRYLPHVNGEHDPDLVDSWYLYHPLGNLGRLAMEGDAEARELFLRSLEFGIKAARHFHYSWPVQYKMSTLEVVVGPRKPGDPGQSDVGGLYAHIMLHAWELTGEDRYLEEAKKAIHALKDMSFELEYQANITAWGAYACLRLWKITADDFYRDQSYVFLASFFHNCLIWESEIANAQHYPIFLGVTCLHDGPYMALYECFESFTSFERYLEMGSDDLPASIRLLLTEYYKYTPSRAWYYYPAELPQGALATEIRNGYINRELAFPLEDLYADGQPAGQVGQEIYGCGAAFSFVTRCYQRLKQAPFLLFCEYPVYDWEEQENSVRFRVRGAEGFACQARLIATRRKPLTAVTIQDAQGNPLDGAMTEEGHCRFTVSVGQTITVRWENTADA